MKKISSTDYKNILNISKDIFKQIEAGKEYPSFYVVNRFKVAADKHTTDALINHMRDVFVKKASKQEFISQKEIGSIYDSMLGLGGGRSYFRNELGDLLPEDRQFKEVTKKEATLRSDSPGELKTEKNEEAIKAFATVFGIKDNKGYANDKFAKNTEDAIKAVFASMDSIGFRPQKVVLAQQNDHFALCSAILKTPKGITIGVNVPVKKIASSFDKVAEHFIYDGELVPLTKENMFILVKSDEGIKKAQKVAMAAAQRGDESKQLVLDNKVVPSELKDFTNFESAIIAAAGNHSHEKLKTALAIVSSELRSFGAFNPKIKVKSSNKNEILFNATVHTKSGTVNLDIPMSFAEKKPLLPAQFYVKTSSGSNDYRFNKAGYDKFISELETTNLKTSVARDTSYIEHMNYGQLLEQVLDGAKNKNFAASNDALQLIQKKFGGDKFLVAMDKYATTLSHISGNVEKDSQKEKFIQAAMKRGELIRRANYSELFSPQFKMPLSKLAFDEEGRLIPLHRIKLDELTKLAGE